MRGPGPRPAHRAPDAHAGEQRLRRQHAAHVRAQRLHRVPGLEACAMQRWLSRPHMSKCKKRANVNCTLWAISPCAAPAPITGLNPALYSSCRSATALQNNYQARANWFACLLSLDGGTHKQVGNTLCFGMLGRGGTAYTVRKEGTHKVQAWASGKHQGCCPCYARHCWWASEHRQLRSRRTQVVGKSWRHSSNRAGSPAKTAYRLNLPYLTASRPRLVIDSI